MMLSSKNSRTDSILLLGILVSLFISMLSLGVVTYLLFTIGQVQFGTAQMLDQVGVGLDEFMVGDAEYMVQVDQIIPINVNFPVKQELTVPLHVQINQEFPLKADIPVNTQIKAPISTIIPISQIFTASIMLFGQPLGIPVEIIGNLPVDIILDIPFEETISIDTMIPISMPVRAVFAVAISQTVPIQTDLPLNMAFPVQLSMQNSTMDNLMLQLETTALGMEAGGQRLVMVVWILSGVLIVTLFVVLGILRLYSISRKDVSQSPVVEINNAG